MTNHDPIQRFLGISAASNPRALLGLNEGRIQAQQIEAALRERLAGVFQHPEGRSPEAEYVRKALRESADELKREISQASVAATSPLLAAASSAQSFSTQPLSQSSTTPGAAPSWLPQRRPSSDPPLFHLTAFDRLVLAALVASGGWNADSRARLVALASANGVTVQGLMRVVQGLSQYARSGGGRLGVSEITAGQSLSQYMPPAPAGPALGSALLDRLTENLSAELKRDDPWPTIKLAVIFGALTLGVLIVAVRIALFPAEAPPAPPTPSGGSTSADTSTPALSQSQQPPARQESPSRRIATYPKNPTFLGNALPGDSIKAVEQFSVVPARLDELARKLIVEERPSEAVFRLWEADIDTIALGWQLSDASTRKQIEAKLLEVLRAAGDRPTVSDRLLNNFIATQTLAGPLDIWRGEWKTFTVWKIASASDLVPPVVRQRALAILQTSLPHAEAHRTAEDAAAAWLDSLVPHLVGMIELNEQSYDYWELWLTAHRGLGKGDRHDASVFSALQAVLASDTDLARPGRTVNVVGRLLNLAIESRSPAIKAGLQSLLDDESIPSRDLWVLTSLLSMNDAATWFPDALVVPDDADMRHRWRIRDELERIWPGEATLAEAEPPANSAASGRPLAVDAELAARWSAAIDAALAQPPQPEPESLLRQVLQASRLIEAADALVAQDQSQFDRMLNDIESNIDARSISVVRRAVARIGQPLGPDATWAVNYQQAGKSPEQRIEAIRTLRTTNAGDLGPVDADVLVREVYRGSPAEVRAAAQEIVTKFSSGPNVAQAMLDQFGDAPTTDAISKVIGDFTGQPLPAARGGGWAFAAKIALLEHALELRPESQSDLDALAAAIADSYATRLGLLRRERMTQSAERLPHHIAAALVQYWHEQAEPLRVANPLPDTLTGLRRRRAMRTRLVDGPMQQFAANQLGIMDLLAYIAVAEQPAKRDALAGILRASADARNAAPSVVEQSLHIERAILRIWRVRLGLGDSSVPAASASDAGARAAPPSFTPTLLPPNDMTQASLEMWLPRLEGLTPSSPTGYFELAEEVADAHSQPPGRDLARWLFAVSGSLDSTRLGRSACLALADLETDAQHKRRLQALASLMGGNLLGQRAVETNNSSAPADPNGAIATEANASTLAAALAMSQGLGHYRAGQGARALEAFRKLGATELLRQFERHLGPVGGAERILDDCKHFRGSARPTLSPDQLTRMLRVEIALLSGADRSWASDLLLFAGQPLIEVDSDRLAETLGVDTTRVLFRNGRWTDR
jgi:hypothetical protein